MPGKQTAPAWLAGGATTLSLIACYGTLAVIALLGALGFAIALNEAIWAGAIITFAILALGGLGFGLVRHRQAWPLLIGALGVATLGYSFYVRYDRLIELVGFIALCLAAYWDWRLRRGDTKTAQHCA